MRKTLLASATLLALACQPALTQSALAQPADQGSTPDAGTATDTPAAPAKPAHHRHSVSQASAGDGQTFAHEPGTGESGPASMKASNIDPATTHSTIAPHLPEPAGGRNAGWRNYLRDAERAIAMHKTGLAQQSLEMAETRLLDRSTPGDAAGQPSSSPVIQQVAEARRALAAGNMAGARTAIDAALAHAPAGEGAMNDAPGMSPGAGMPAGAPMGAPADSAGGAR